MWNVDIAIVGGGMVGLALACGLQGSGLRVVVLESTLPESIASSYMLSRIRVSAINVASEKLLNSLGVWSEVISCHASCYKSIEVWDKDTFGHLVIDNIGSGCSHLGHIVENVVIHNALWQQAQQCIDVTLIAPIQVRQVVWRENDVYITLNNDDVLVTRLLVGADGGNSWLRSKANIPFTICDYPHHALIAIVRTIEPHNAIARQIFYNEGILALLPLNDPHLCSIVWSLKPRIAQYMLTVTPEIFNQELYVICNNCLGWCTLKSKREVLPLIGRYAWKFAGHRIVLIGDAAHTIHPLAGQGVNLGFMDVVELIGELLRLYHDGRDIGNYLYLRRYERKRKHSAAMMLATIQIFQGLFSGSNFTKKLLRDIGLNFANFIFKENPKIIRKVIGLYNLPEWFIS